METAPKSPFRRPGPVGIFLIALLILAIFRAWFNTVIPLTGEEAYYWAWSRHLDFCYFDHPPLIAWVIRFFTTIFGETVFAIRFSALVLHTATAVLVFLIARRVFQDKLAASWAGALFTMAIFFAATATFTIPDGVLFFCWALVVLSVLWAIQPGKNPLWIVVGIALGLSALAKFHSILLAAAIGLFLLLSPRHRRTYRSGWLYLGALVAALMTIPIFWWNAQNNWVTLGFQLAGRHKWRLGSPVYFLEMVGAPFGYIGLVALPLCAAGVVWGLGQARRKGRADLLLLSLACLVPFLFFIALSVFIKIDPQWAAPGFVTGVILAAGFGVQLARRSQRSRLRKHLLPIAVGVNGFLMVCGYALGLALMAHPSMIPEKDVHLFGYRRKLRTGQLDRMYGWEEIGERLRKEIDTLGGIHEAIVLSASGYGTGSALYFYTEGHPPVYLIEDRPIKKFQFLIWERRANLQGKSAVAVLRRRGDEEDVKKQRRELKRWLLGHFDARSVKEVLPIRILRDGRIRQEYYVFHARSSRPSPTPADTTAGGRE